MMKRISGARSPWRWSRWITRSSTAANGREALEESAPESLRRRFLDLKLSQESGLDVLEEIVRVSPQTFVVIVTAYASVETAVEAMRRRAFDYLPKPCTPEQIRHVLNNVERTRKLERRVADLESRLMASAPEADLPPITRHAQGPGHGPQGGPERGDRPPSRRNRHWQKRAWRGRFIAAVAAQKGAFVTVSCPSLSRELLESEFFGHVKGAFTGAHQDTMGKVAAANGGTLFLDEIGELPLEVQAKLLRLFQEREYERVGENNPRRANVRIISATNRDLGESVQEGTFREDLYYRLNVISLRLPPLRERRQRY